MLFVSRVCPLSKVWMLIFKLVTVKGCFALPDETDSLRKEALRSKVSKIIQKLAGARHIGDVAN